ncbi:MAG: hypothetical protein RJA22_652 [Verrucomicrobiota bacterium]|jgi:hypothetical protein
MSLINDALKRAKQTQPNAPRTPAAAGPMEPAPEAPRGLPWFFFPAVLAVLGVAGWLLIKGWDAHRQSIAQYGKPVTIQAREITPPPSLPTAPAVPAAVETAAATSLPDRDDTGSPVATPVEEAAFVPPVNQQVSAPYTAVNRTFALDQDTPDPQPAATPVAEAAPAPATAPVNPAAPLPTFRLQGIFFRTTNPSAMVNGKSVLVGDFVSGARVKAIEREQVTLEYEGQTKTLTLR